MIEISKRFKDEELQNIDGVSKYEILYNKDELKELSERYRLLSKRRYILPTIAYFLFIIPVPTGIAIAYLGILWNQGEGLSGVR